MLGCGVLFCFSRFVAGRRTGAERDFLKKIFCAERPQKGGGIFAEDVNPYKKRWAKPMESTPTYWVGGSTCWGAADLRRSGLVPVLVGRIVCCRSGCASAGAPFSADFRRFWACLGVRTWYGSFAQRDAAKWVVFVRFSVDGFSGWHLSWSAGLTGR